MRGVAFFLLFALVACATGDAVTPASASSELREWRTAMGKPPSENEFAAVVAACEDRAKRANNNGSIEGCLADYGLRRVQ
jgi:ABC-type sugar transport system substrate-binding protein